MAIQLYEDQVYVSNKQLDQNDIPIIKSLNIKSVICNRHDNEELNQPKFESTKQLLIKNDILNIVQQSIAFPIITIKDALLLEKHLKNIPKPILLYCKTGSRSIFLLSMIKAYHQYDIEEILNKADNMSYYLEQHRNYFEFIKNKYKIS